MARVLLPHRKPVSVQATGAKHPNHATRRTLVGMIVTVLALGGVGIEASIQHPAPLGGSDVLILVFLAIAVAMSRIWPLHIGQASRLCMADVPLYLLCTLLAPLPAATGVGLGMVVGELIIRRRCGNIPGDIGSQVGRWVLLALGVSTLVHLQVVAGSVFAGAVAGGCLWAGDILTAPLVFSPITGKDPLVTVVQIARRSWPAEPMQYIIGLLALLVLQSDLRRVGMAWTDGLAVLVVILSVVLLYVYLKGEDDLKRLA